MGPSFMESAGTGSIVGVGALSYDRSYYIGLLFLVLALVFAIVKARGIWDEIHEKIEPDPPEDLLRSFEAAHAAGEIDDAELARVKARLAGGSPGLAAPVPAPPVPSPPIDPGKKPRSGHRLEGHDTA